MRLILCLFPPGVKLKYYGELRRQAASPGFCIDRKSLLRGRDRVVDNLAVHLVAITLAKRQNIWRRGEYFTCLAVPIALILNHMVKCSPRLLNRTFAALAHPTRRRILEHLAHGDRCVTDLARPHSMSLPAISKHLRVLENAGLIRRRRSGRVHSLKLEAAPMKPAQEWIEEYRHFWEESFDRWDEYLKDLQKKEKKHEHKK
jgi:DNA-binding transcriptional ArsR family regulator